VAVFILHFVLTEKMSKFTWYCSVGRVKSDFSLTIINGVSMSEQKIKVRVTETDAIMQVLVYSKNVDKIEVMLGEGIHSVKCELLPTENGIAYVGTVMGREVVYERSREQVQADIELENHDYRDSRRR
jgi:copper homeostasis protein CutC